MLVRFWFYLILGGPRRRRLAVPILAGAENRSRFSQGMLDLCYERVRATHHAPGGPCRLLERGHGLAKIVERGAVVSVEHPPVKQPHFERDSITVSENPSRHGHRFTQE